MYTLSKYVYLLYLPLGPSKLKIISVARKVIRAPGRSWYAWFNVATAIIRHSWPLVHYSHLLEWMGKNANVLTDAATSAHFSHVWRCSTLVRSGRVSNAASNATSAWWYVYHERYILWKVTHPWPREVQRIFWHRIILVFLDANSFMIVNESM